MERKELTEIKHGQTGYGLLIECDGYIKPRENGGQILEAIGTDPAMHNEGWYCPDPLVFEAVFQRYGAENANGRIYPEDILKREDQKYQTVIREKRAFGECYTPDAMILTETGWKTLSEVSEGENILTLNPETKEVEIKPIKRVVKYNHNGKMYRVSGNSINDLVTPEHGFPLFNSENDFYDFVTAEQLLNDIEIYQEFYIPSDESWDDIKTQIAISDISISMEDYDGDVMCVEVENHIWYVMDNGKCHWTKNCNHPSDTTIDLSRVAIVVLETHWVGNTLVGKVEVITSEGFRKYGIISCEGDQVANLLLRGYKIGLSSRGVGSVEKKFGTIVVGDDYELICYDVVSDPSTHNAWIVNNTTEGIPQEYMESKVTNKPKIIENLEKFGSWLND